MEPIHENVLNLFDNIVKLASAGNHDHALVEKMSMLHYQSYAIESILVAKGQIKKRPFRLAKISAFKTYRRVCRCQNFTDSCSS